MVPQKAIEQLKSQLRGQVFRPEDAGYDAARKIWNGMIDKRPALIARCSGAGDVVHSVKFAREHELTVAVRGGGHNIAGKCLADDGFLIDLSGMKGVRVDPGRRTARAEAGAKLGDFDRETQAFGLATAFWIARAMHVGMLLMLCWLVVLFGLGKMAMLGVAVVAILLLYEHSIISPKDLRRMNAAFFTLNGVISVVFFMFIALDVLTQR